MVWVIDRKNFKETWEPRPWHLGTRPKRKPCFACFSLFFWGMIACPFFSTIVSLGFSRLSRKKEPWKEWGRYHSSFSILRVLLVYFGDWLMLTSLPEFMDFNHFWVLTVLVAYKRFTYLLFWAPSTRSEVSGHFDGSTIGGL